MSQHLYFLKSDLSLSVLTFDFPKKFPIALVYYRYPPVEMHFKNCIAIKIAIQKIIAYIFNLC